MSKIVLTNMCMVVDEKKEVVLVQDRKKSWQGLTFPGGKVEPKESIIDSTIREVKEETGLDVTQLTLCGVKDWYEEKEDFRYIVFLYKTNQFTGTLLKETDEGSLHWMKVEDLTEENCASGFAKTLDVFNYPEKQEHFFHYNENEELISNQVI
ncbi:MAG: 8-oxo-dGTP diphosphatase [Desemzia incerta]|uniref:8-oxo-dGTP diphosphatase n=1 Tax=Desemzia incerta TaxID=82801 RepID=UPI00331584D1